MDESGAGMDSVALTLFRTPQKTTRAGERPAGPRLSFLDRNKPCPPPPAERRQRAVVAGGGSGRRAAAVRSGGGSERRRRAVASGWFGLAFYTVAPQAPHPVAPKAPQLAPKAPQIAPQAPQTAPKALKCQRIGKNACWCTIGISTTKAAGAFGHL
eukprot:gene17695-biopygen3880